VFAVARRWERALPPRTTVAGPPPVFRLGRWRRPAAVLAALFSIAFLALPMGSLVWRAGLSGRPAAWSPLTVAHHLAVVGRAEAGVLLKSLIVAVLTGGACAGLALVACWACLDARRLRSALLVLMAVAWALPGPIVGLGLKGTFEEMLRLTDSSFVAAVFWHGPSPAPLVWADFVRFFPCAVAILWPAVRQTPRELRDAARMDGATPGQELGQVVWPLHAGAVLRAALAVGILTLGELSADKPIFTPGWPGYAQTIFEQMHFGVTNDLAARCLWLLAAATAGTALFVALRPREEE
jgi:ABC-type Fe3+ transport system permease subunit